MFAFTLSSISLLLEVYTIRETAACFTLGEYKYVFLYENIGIEFQGVCRTESQLLAVPAPSTSAPSAAALAPAPAPQAVAARARLSAEISLLDITGGNAFSEAREAPVRLKDVERLTAFHGLSSAAPADFVAAILRIALGVGEAGACPLPEFTKFALDECRSALSERSSDSVGVAAMRNLAREMPKISY